MDGPSNMKAEDAAFANNTVTAIAIDSGIAATFLITGHPIDFLFANGWPP